MKQEVYLEWLRPCSPSGQNCPTCKGTRGLLVACPQFIYLSAHVSQSDKDTAVQYCRAEKLNWLDAPLILGTGVTGNVAGSFGSRTVPRAQSVCPGRTYFGHLGVELESRSSCRHSLTYSMLLLQIKLLRPLLLHVPSSGSVKPLTTATRAHMTSVVALRICIVISSLGPLGNKMSVFG